MSPALADQVVALAPDRTPVDAGLSDHVPLVLDETGRRLAKREDDLSLRELRQGGTDPRAIVAWAAKSCGIACGSRVTARVALINFALAKLPKEPVVLDGETVAELRAAR